MQIRVANKQDEAEIRNFVDSIYQESGSAINLESIDSDLRNVEGSYFGKEGLFLVAEEDGKIVGVGGARKKTESVLELKRLLARATGQDEILEEMLRVIVEFAPRLLYERIETSSQAADVQSILREKGFTPAKNGLSEFSLAVTPDF